MHFHFRLKHRRFLNSFLLQLDIADAKIILLTSPMADAKVRAALKNYLGSIVDYFHKIGDTKLYDYVYEKSYNGGCLAHPNLKEQKEISDLLLAFIKKNLKE